MNNVKPAIYYPGLLALSMIFVAGFTQIGSHGFASIIGASMAPFIIGSAMSAIHSRTSGVVATLAACLLMLIGNG